jgi:hypothetical protein
MRTTISIDDELLDRAKARAHQQGVTLGALLEDALRDALATDRSAAKPVELPVSTVGGGLMPGIEPTTRGLLAALDEGQPLDRLR